MVSKIPRLRDNWGFPKRPLHLFWNMKKEKMKKKYRDYLRDAHGVSGVEISSNELGLIIRKESHT